MKNKNQEKIILDLCGGTGSWAKPYKDAGYDVRTITLPEYSVLNKSIREKTITFWGQNGNSEMHVDIEKVYGILAAPPCTMFSMARTRAKTPRDLRGGASTSKRMHRNNTGMPVGRETSGFLGVGESEGETALVFRKATPYFQPLRLRRQIQKADRPMGTIQ